MGAICFEDTYSEFLMQVQLYDPAGKYQTFSKLLAENPKAERLHFPVSPAVTGYINQLSNKIPTSKIHPASHFFLFIRIVLKLSFILKQKEHA